MDAQLSPWWRRSLVVLMVCGFSVLGFLAARTYRDAPPIPARVVDEAGRTLFTGADITAGQQVFLRHGLMENGSIWGHGAYLGPDFSAEYLHTLGLEVQAFAGAKTLPRSGSTDVNFEPALDVEVARILKRNRYEASTGQLMFTDAEAASFRSQHDKWRSYFADPASNGGLPKNFITDPVELH